MLDLLIYTDATADESLTGSPGFQFVAHSAGATRVDEGIVREQLQHSVPENVLADNWEQHPATCAYIRVEGRMYLSRGLSTGATLGGRPGNQLTVTLMTSDPYEIIPLCPAQLYSSPIWSFDRPTRKDLPGWATPLEISEEFDVAGLHDMVVNDTWATDILPRVLTMLEQTQLTPRSRLFIRHSDQWRVMRWLALLSRFLGVEAALGLEFRVFASDPVRTNAHVVGVHPLISPELTASMVANVGANLLDLEGRDLTRIAPSEAAKRHADWFISGDPYDALEAIEVSRRWSRCIDPGDAAALAGLIVMGCDYDGANQQTTRIVLGAIVKLSQFGQADELEIYSEEFGELIRRGLPLTSSELDLLDAAIWAAAGRGLSDLAQELTLAALRWTSTQPNLFEGWSRISRPTAKLQWCNGDERRQGAVMLAVALNTAARESLPDAFALARALDTGISLDVVGAAVAMLVDYLVTNPELSSSAHNWEHSDAIIERLVETVDAKLTEGDESVRNALAGGSWDWLAPVPWQMDRHNRLSRWFAGRELEHADGPRRLEVLGIVQSVLPNDAWCLLLPMASGLDPNEVVGWIGAHGDLDPSLGAEVALIIGDISRFPDWQRNGGVRVLDAIGSLDTLVHDPLKTILDDHKLIVALFARAIVDRDKRLNPALGHLGGQFGGRLNFLYSELIAEVVLEVQDTQSAVALAEGEGRQIVIGNVRDRLLEALRKPTSSAMLSAMRLLNPSLDRAWTKAAKDALDVIWDDRSREGLQKWLLASVGERGNRSERSWLRDYVDAQSKGRVRRNAVRGTKSLFGNRAK